MLNKNNSTGWQRRVGPVHREGKWQLVVKCGEKQAAANWQLSEFHTVPPCHAACQKFLKENKVKTLREKFAGNKMNCWQSQVGGRTLHYTSLRFDSLSTPCRCVCVCGCVCISVRVCAEVFAAPRRQPASELKRSG